MLIITLFLPVVGYSAADSVSHGAYFNSPADSSGIFLALKLSAKELKTKTGVYTLENGGKSLAARLWLIDHAVKSLDIQYYSVARNVTGVITCEHIVRAADRGVKVRLLVDDAASRMNAYEVRVLDKHENIEIRVYNAGLKVGRIDKRLTKLAANSNRLLRRMHNKTMVVDEQVTIAGGRNVSNEYFDFGKKYNFRDRDVMLFGKASVSAEKSFNLFWGDKLTVTVEELVGNIKGPFDIRELFDKVKKLFNDTLAYGPSIRAHINAFPAEIANARRDGRFLLLEAVSFVSDVPGKNEEKKERTGGATTDTIIALIRSARHTVDIQSPYFITNDETKKLLRETVDRGLKVRIITNSLGSTDNYEAFSGYQRDRKGNLATGVELHEFRPNAAVRFDLMIPDVQAKNQHRSVYGLHSKTMIIDEYISVIGSYNLDPRSANLNTECIVIIRSKEAAKNLARYVEEEFLPRNSWLTTSDFNPDSEASWKKRFKAFSRRIFPKKLL
ncbi:MAG: phospholipase D family protein [Bacteroidota bacterium]